MSLKDFIGKVVIGREGGGRYTISEITSPYISVSEVALNSAGCHSSYRFGCINGDPISRGVLVFEDPTLTEPFIRAYNDYCHTENAYYEEIGYWM